MEVRTQDKATQVGKAGIRIGAGKKKVHDRSVELAMWPYAINI